MSSKNGFGGPSNNVRRITNKATRKKDKSVAFYQSFNTTCIGKSLFCLIVGFILGSLLNFSSTNDDTRISGGSGQQKRAFAHKSDVHSSGFGGINNIAQPGGAKAYSKGEGLAHISDEDLIPYYVTTGQDDINDNDSSLSTLAYSLNNKEIPSLGRPNLINAYGHYVHDEFRSPYASHLYSMPKEALEKEQERFLKQMKSVREEWGAWTDIVNRLPDNNPLFQTGKEERVNPDFKSVLLRDLPNSKFPLESWQMNEGYVSTFMDEAKALITRVKEGIYAEYGFPIHKKGTDLKYIEEIISKFSIGTEPKDIPGKIGNTKIAWLTPSGMDGLVRKLLHGLITNDDFYVVLSGHSAAAGHGNNFQQNKVLGGMHHILEPVFDKLGMRLISRNMGMGGVGTLQFSMAGKSVLGEADFLVWDSSMTENGKTVDFFNKQAIFSGARMPILFSSSLFGLLPETNNTAWAGGINYGFFYSQGAQNGFLPPTIDEVQAKKVPYAARYLNIAKAENHKLGAEEKYNSICWEDRTDVQPDVDQGIPGGRASWHPGFRSHQMEGRIYSLILLEGLKQAFELWERGIETDGFPLSENYWHVKEAYQTQRETYRTHIREKQEPSACEQQFAFSPRICTSAMSGYGMWTPHNMANKDLVTDIIQPAPNGYKPQYAGDILQYDSFDLLPHIQRIPDGEVDVHAIAIATTNSPPEGLDHDFIEEDNNNNDNNENTTENRRMLRSISQGAIHHASQQQKEILKPKKSSEDMKSLSSHKEQYDDATTQKETTKPNKNEKEEKTPLHNENMDSIDDGNSWIPPLSKRHHRELQNDILQKELIILAPKNSDPAGEEDIVPGRGWDLHPKDTYSLDSYCDGSSVSIPNNRAHGSKCLMYGSNDAHNAVSGNSLSGWLVMKIPKIKEGIILARMEWWCSPPMEITNDWTTVNNGKTTDTAPLNATDDVSHRELSLQQNQGYTNYPDDEYEYNILNNNNDNHHRELGKPTRDQLIPKDFFMDVAINKHIVYTYTAETWTPFSVEPSKNCAVWPLLNDPEFRSKLSSDNENWQGEEIEVAIRFRSESNPQQGFCLSHLYYA